MIAQLIGLHFVMVAVTFWLLTSMMRTRPEAEDLLESEPVSLALTILVLANAWALVLPILGAAAMRRRL